MTKEGGADNSKKGALKTIPSSSPLFLHPSDNPGIMITQKIFNGDNYDNWADAVRMGLDSKNKLAFLDGKIEEPAFTEGEEESVEHVAWRQCIAMIKTWVRNVIDPKLHASIAFSGTIDEIWNELKERYATGNAPRIHKLKAELTELKQRKMSIVEYYTKLKTIWDELGGYSRVSKCTCGAGKDILKEKEEEKVHQFLMGLDDDLYGGLRTNLLMEEPIPSLTRVYGIMLREERHKAIMRSKEVKVEDGAAFSVRKGQPSNRGGRGGRSRGVNEQEDDEGRCTFCTKWGHDEDDCWSKHGLPPHIAARGRGMGRSTRGRGAGGYGRGEAGGYGRGEIGGYGRGEARQQSWKANVVHANQEVGESSTSNGGRATNRDTVSADEIGLTRDELKTLRALLHPAKENHMEKMAGPIYEEDDWSG